MPEHNQTAAAWAPAGRGRRRIPASAWVWSGLSMVLYGLLTTQQWLHYVSPSWDLGIFTQVVQRYAQLQAPIVHIKGADYNILGDHFHPILVLLAPAYAVAPSAYTLLIAQVVLVATSVFFIALAADRVLGTSGGWLVGGAYAVCWGVQEAVAVQFHEVACGLPLLAVCMWALLRERWWTAAISGGLLVFVKEDLGLTVAVLGLIVALRSGRWILGAALAGWGMLWFALTMKVILPALNPRGEYDYAGAIDVSTVLADPVATLTEILTNEKKMATLLLLLACTGFLLVRSSLALAVVPTLAWRFLSSTEGHWGTGWHYSLLLMPVAYAAVIDAVAKLSRSRFSAARVYARSAPVVVLTFALSIFNQLPLWTLHRLDVWQITERNRSAASLLATIPRGTTVAADVSLMSHLVDHHDVYYIGHEGNPVTDFVVIDNEAGGWSGPVDAVGYAQSVYPGTKWQKTFDANSYQAAKRVG